MRTLICTPNTQFFQEQVAFPKTLSLKILIISHYQATLLILPKLPNPNVLISLQKPRAFKFTIISSFLFRFLLNMCYNRQGDLLKNQKWLNHIPRPFPLKVFTIIYFFLVYLLHALMYGLKFIFKLKKLKLLKDL